MKSICYTPNICKKEGSQWSGTITLRLPTFDEKFGYIESESFEDDGTGDVQASTKAIQRIKTARKLVAFSEKFYLNVDLKNLQTGEVINSFDAMKQEEEMFATLFEVSEKIISGFKVGNG